MAKTDLYQQIDLKARVESASPHQLISLLYEGLLASLSALRLALESGDLEGKSRHLTRSTSILHALRDALYDDVDSDFPHNVRRLYDYMITRLVEAGRTLDAAPVAEVSELLLTIKSGWDRIDPNLADLQPT